MSFTSPVRPGTGWPGDLADAETPVARTPQQVTRAAARVTDLDDLGAQSSVCRACPRLVTWREKVAVEKRRAFADEPYWGRPTISLGSDEPRIVILGLAPAAHGGNRTGRIFTGDRSGDWLFASLHRVGLARLATSTRADDGQALHRTRMIAPVRCAPPQNKPTVSERDTCAHWLDAELRLVLPSLAAVVPLGGYAWSAALAAFERLDLTVPRPRPRFGHAAEAVLPTGPDTAVRLIGSYHPSQQNTFTGRLTEPMLDAVFRRAKEVADV